MTDPGSSTTTATTATTAVCEPMTARIGKRKRKRGAPKLTARRRPRKSKTSSSSSLTTANTSTTNTSTTTDTTIDASSSSGVAGGVEGGSGGPLWVVYSEDNGWERETWKFGLCFADKAALTAFAKLLDDVETNHGAPERKKSLEYFRANGLDVTVNGSRTYFSVDVDAVYTNPETMEKQTTAFLPRTSYMKEFQVVRRSSLITIADVDKCRRELDWAQLWNSLYKGGITELF
jgi:hypothetical protein